MGKRRDRRYGWRAAVMTLALLCLRGTSGQAYAQEGEEKERLICYSSSYKNSSEIPAAPEKYQEAGAVSYRLADTEIERVPVRGRIREVSGEIRYPGVTKEQEIPGEAPMEIEDKESRTSVSAVLPLQRVSYENESWQENLEISVVFHEYGADTYRLGDIEISQEGEGPPLENCQEELLASAGLSSEETKIQSVRWEGDSYQDEEGVWCRNAVVQARQRVWDCLAVYGGEVELPAYNRYRMRMEYEKVEPETEAETETEGTAAENEEEREKEYLPVENIPLPFWRRWIHYGLAVSVSLLLLLAVWGGFRLLRKMADEKNRG